MPPTLEFYQSKPGFEVLYRCGGDRNGEDHFAIMERDQVMLMFKAITPEVHPQPVEDEGSDFTGVT